MRTAHSARGRHSQGVESLGPTPRKHARSHTPGAAFGKPSTVLCTLQEPLILTRSSPPPPTGPSSLSIHRPVLELHCSHKEGLWVKKNKAAITVFRHPQQGAHPETRSPRIYPTLGCWLPRKTNMPYPQDVLFWWVWEKGPKSSQNMHFRGIT